MGSTLSLPFTIELCLRDNRHIVITGAPGSGKTTLLKFLALTFARDQALERLELNESRIPIFVALREFNRYIDRLLLSSPHDRSPSLLPDYLEGHHRANFPQLKLPGGFFHRILAEGRAIVLFDGLDEVADSSKRVRAAELVAVFLRNSGPSNRFAITSRPRGYAIECRQHLAAFCGECHICDFDDTDIAEFARGWYLAVTIDRLGDTTTARDLAESAGRALTEAVRAPRIRPLAANPLLLCILALIHQRGIGLPQRRVDLYQECCEFLLGYWDQVRGGEAAYELANLGGLSRQEKLRLMEPIALWLHERGEAGLEAGQKEFESTLTIQFRELYGDSDAVARRRSELFLQIITDRAGLLVEREAGLYAFAHLTFQEYASARCHGPGKTSQLGPGQNQPP